MAAQQLLKDKQDWSHSMTRRLMPATKPIKTALLFAFLSSAIAAAAFAQSAPGSSAPVVSTNLKFDVVSIKPSQSNPSGSARCTADGYTAKGVSLSVVILDAYHLRYYQLLGKPLWVDKDPYEIQAKVSDADLPQFQKGGRPTCLAMLQALLADRFKLTVRRATTVLPVYNLVVAKSGPLFKESAPDGATTGNAFAGQVQMKAVPMSMLATILSMNLQSPVTDKTGLTGKYDITLHWTPVKPDFLTAADGPPTGLPDDPQASIVDAVQEQLGLKLEPAKGPVETLTVEHVERPAEN
jgi:uncharacterized protein (TIGR03435 family)